MRQLRDGAGLGPAELAARAHYPYDRIRAAEVGPSLPDLPVLSAYVRGCGGTSEEWEERWRSLTSAPTLPLLAARPAGCSTAASAGARVGSISPAADTPDPSLILAALDRVAEEMAVSAPASPAPSVFPVLPASPTPLPSRSGAPTIEQRSGIAPAPAAPAAKAASGMAGVGQADVWETTTTRTAWGDAIAPTAWEADLPPAVAQPDASTGGPGAFPAESVKTGAGDPRAAGSLAATSVQAESAGAAWAGGSTAAEPVGTSATSASYAASARLVGAADGVAAAPGPAESGRRSSGLSRTTIAALIVIAICVLVAALAVFA